MDIEGRVRGYVESALRLPLPAAMDQLKRQMSESIRDGSLRLPERFRKAHPDSYARRLLYADADAHVTAIVMTWGPGQATPIHDHAGTWCVEGVVEGEMEITQYEMQEEAEDACRLVRRSAVRSGMGSAGCLIPPFEHHVMRNATGEVSLTLHVYGGEMRSCNIYVPRADGWYQRRARVLECDL